MESFICLFGLIIFMMMILLAGSIKIVPEYQRLLIFRLGRSIGVRGPGLVLAIPFIDRAVPVDLRPTERKPEGVKFTSRDNDRLSADWRWVYQIIDPEKSILNVANFQTQMEGAAQLLFAEMFTGDLMTGRAEIEARLKERLDAVAVNCGLRVNEVQILEIKKIPAS